MENLSFFSGVALGALLSGYLFFTCYDRLDCFFFGGSQVGAAQDYEPFGRSQLLVSAVCGVLISGLYCFGYFVAELKVVVAAIVVAILAYNLYQASVRMHSFGARAGKFAFLASACSVCFGVGILGSLPIFIILVS